MDTISQTVILIQDAANRMRAVGWHEGPDVRGETGSMFSSHRTAVVTAAIVFVLFQQLCRCKQHHLSKCLT